LSQINANEVLSSTSFRALRRSLDFLAMREQLSAENIANVDTPGFKARGLDFESQLDRIVNPRPPKLVSTDARHFGGSADVKLVSTSADHFPVVGKSDEPQPEFLDSLSARVDENTVDLDREMALLAETQLAFGTIARLLTARMDTIRAVARDVR
jgi:flagellar basal-body rod protein FlgB